MAFNSEQNYYLQLYFYELHSFVGYMMSLFQKISTTNIITRIQRLIIDIFSFSFSL